MNSPVISLILLITTVVFVLVYVIGYVASEILNAYLYPPKKKKKAKKYKPGEYRLKKCKGCKTTHACNDIPRPHYDENMFI